MERCSTCGAVLTPGAAWCGQCFAAVAPASAGPAASPAAPQPFVPGRHVPQAPPERMVRRTRWAKSATTFGPAGRMVATFAVVVPLIVMIVGGFADPFAWAGAGVWGAIIVPWALRDIWKAGLVPVA